MISIFMVDLKNTKDYLKEILENVALILWIIASEWGKMPITITLIGAVAIFIVLSAYRIWSRRSEDKIASEKLRTDAQVKSEEIFWNKPSIIESEKYLLRQQSINETYSGIIRALEESASEQARSDVEKQIYGDIIKRLKDMQKG
jgi:hypothetical protein